MEDEPEIHEEQLQIFDPLIFRLAFDGVYASIKLNRENPARGMTKAQAEARLAKWFPEAKSIEIDSEI